MGSVVTEIQLLPTFCASHRCLIWIGKQKCLRYSIIAHGWIVASGRLAGSANS